MKTLFRNSLAIGGGAFASFALTFAMMDMISVDFRPEAKSKSLEFEINPIEKVVEPPTRLPTPPELETIDVPPSPPRIETATSSLPTEPIVPMDTGIPTFDPVTLDGFGPISVNMDTEMLPIFRVPGTMPTRANRSGHCLMEFSVGANGQPYDVKASYCTQEIFRRPSIKAAQKFKYNPRQRNGQAVSVHGVRTKITYRLTDEAGHVIPE